MKNSISVFGLMILSFNSFGQTRLPYNVNLSSYQNNTHLNISCEEMKGGQKINCHINQVWAYKPDDEFKKNQITDIEKVVNSEGVEKMKNLYSTTIENKIEKQERFNSMNSQQKSYQNSYDLAIKGIENSNTKDELKKALYKLKEIENDTCTIMTNNYDEEFTKISGNKWGTNTEKQGLCDTVSYSELEGDTSGKIWKYSYTVLSTNTSQSFCVSTHEKSIGKKQSYSSISSTAQEQNCKYIKY